MARLQLTDGLSDEQAELLKLVREFVDEQIIPVAMELERKDEYPTQIVEGMKEMGIFGLMIPEEYGGLGESLLTYALCVEEIARGWMSVSGIINTHFIVAYMLIQHGTEEQKRRYLPRMATGEVRGAFSMSEPGCGSDVAAITSKAVTTGDGEWTLNGQKMWLTNGASSNLVAVLVKTDTGADSVYRNMTTFLIDKEPGFGEVEPGLTVPGKIEKMGYKGVDTTELILDGYRTTTDQILGGEPGKGFYQMMDGVEVGRVNVSARACGVALRAFELAIAYAQQRETFGKKIAEHQAVLFRLVLGDLLAEGLTLLGVGDRELERPQRHTTGAGGDVDAAHLDPVHHLVETFARLATQNLIGRRAIAVKNELGRVDALVAHLLDLAGHGQARFNFAKAGLLVDQERCHVPVHRVCAGVRLHKHRDEIR